MCGIAGAVDFGGRRVDDALVSRMCGALHHRGPDDEGIVSFPRAGAAAATHARATAVLGSRRLSIIDVAGGHQPIGNEDGTVWAVLNGEIYNFQALRAELEQKGHRFATRSDSEVIVHVYEERGEDFVAALDGMFALALWDDRTQRLFLARDRFGKKPLLYAETGERLRFASEFQALLVDPDLPREIDPVALHYYTMYMAVPAPLSAYRGIRKLPPAHLLIRDRRGTTVRRYWRLAYAPKLALGQAEAAAGVLELLTAAVKKRLVSDVPLGAFLSGGVDSSAVVALMTRLGSRPVRTFSMGFEEAGYDELVHARRVAERYGTEHHEFVVQPRAVEILPTLVRHFGEPFADSSAIPCFELARATREHVTVALSGDGGDEAFGGYRRHLAFCLAETPGAARALGPMARLARRRALRGRPQSRLEQMLMLLQGVSLPRAARYARWAGVFSGDLHAEVFLLPAPLPDGDLVHALVDEAGTLGALDAILSADTGFYLPTDLLVKVDITSMANSLEVRSPFLDHHLVEFAARLPGHLKVRPWSTKHLLKHALGGVVPEANLVRGKQGFAVPIARWLRGELREFVADHMLAPRALQRGLVRPEAVRRLLSAHQDGRADHSHQLWTLLMLELWHRAFIDR